MWQQEEKREEGRDLSSLGGIGFVDRGFGQLSKMRGSPHSRRDEVMGHHSLSAGLIAPLLPDRLLPLAWNHTRTQSYIVHQTHVLSHASWVICCFFMSDLSFSLRRWRSIVCRFLLRP